MLRRPTLYRSRRLRRGRRFPNRDGKHRRNHLRLQIHQVPLCTNVQRLVAVDPLVQEEAELVGECLQYRVPVYELVLFNG